MHRARSFVCTLLVLATGTLRAEPPVSPTPATPVMLANACAGCHGTLGVSIGQSIPGLAGQSKSTLVDALQDFKSGARPATVMGRIARGYSDDEIAAIADFYAGVKKP